MNIMKMINFNSIDKTLGFKREIQNNSVKSFNVRFFTTCD